MMHAGTVFGGGARVKRNQPALTTFIRLSLRTVLTPIQPKYPVIRSIPCSVPALACC